jgi:hypothetical protein
MECNEAQTSQKLITTSFVQFHVENKIAFEQIISTVNRDAIFWHRTLQFDINIFFFLLAG